MLPMALVILLVPLVSIIQTILLLGAVSPTGIGILRTRSAIWTGHFLPSAARFGGSQEARQAGEPGHCQPRPRCSIQYRWQATVWPGA